MLVTSSIAVWVYILTFGHSLANADKLPPGQKASNPTGSAMAYSCRYCSLLSPVTKTSPDKAIQDST